MILPSGQVQYQFTGCWVSCLNPTYKKSSIAVDSW